MSSIEAVCPLSSFSFLIIGLLARQYPGVATSVKTGQAIRHVLNNMQERIQELRFSGGLDETEGSKLETVRQKKNMPMITMYTVSGTHKVYKYWRFECVL